MSDAGVKQRGDQPRTSADIGGAPRGLVKKVARAAGEVGLNCIAPEELRADREEPSVDLSPALSLDKERESEPEARRGCW